MRRRPSGIEFRHEHRADRASSVSLRARQQAGHAAILVRFLPLPGLLLLIASIASISRVMNLVPVKHAITSGGLARCPMPSLNLSSGPSGGGH